jgi:hypothetical protein
VIILRLYLSHYPEPPHPWIFSLVCKKKKAADWIDATIPFPAPNIHCPRSHISWLQVIAHDALILTVALGGTLAFQKSYR